MKTQNYECCMCGDHGLSHELFRCKVCHFRSQHRYCSNLYPKAESYRVCNWCLIQKDDNDNDNENDNSNRNRTTIGTTRVISNNHRVDGPGPKSMKPISPIKKPMMTSAEAQSPSGRKRITAVNCHQVKDDRLRRTKSSQELKMANNNNNNNNNNNYSNSSSGSRSSGGGPIVIKHVFRNKVRRYKLLDEVSS